MEPATPVTECPKPSCRLTRDADADSRYCMVHFRTVILSKPLPDPRYEVREPRGRGRHSRRQYVPPEETDPATMRAELIEAHNRNRHKGPQPQIFPNRAEVRVLSARARERIL